MLVPDNDMSCYLTSFIIKYVKNIGISEEKLFQGIKEKRGILENPLEWTDSYTLIKLCCNVEEVFRDRPNLMWEIGKAVVTQDINSFQVFFLRIAPLLLISKNIELHIKKNVCKNLEVKTEFISDNQFDIYYRPINRERYALQMCNIDKGATFTTLQLRGYKNLHLNEISCAARDKKASTCHYRLTWTPRSNLINKIKNFLFFRFRDQRSIINHIETSHKNLQKQYKQIVALKDFYSHIMNNMSEGIVWLNDQGQVTFANKGFVTLSGYEHDEILGKYFWNFLSNDSVSREYQSLIMKCKDHPQQPESHEMVLVRNDGEKRISQTNIIWVPSEHRDPGFLVNIRDITDHRKIERKLFTSEDRYQSLYENSPAIIIGFDLEGNFIFANPAMEEQCGYTEEELKNMHFGQLVAPKADFEVQRLFKGKLDQGIRLQEVHFKTKSGEWKVIVLNSYPIRNEVNENIGVAGIGVDITETKRLNEQLVQTQRMDLLGKMAGGLAHDFNNMLNVILVYSMNISNKVADDKLKKYAENIQKASQRAAKLTQSLLTFSRGETVEKSKFDLNGLIKEVHSFAQPVVPKSITISTEIPDRPILILGDSGKIHQCLLNLCLNARDTIGYKSGSINIRVKDSPQTGFVLIEVEDSGAGIAPDIIEKIFDPFFTTKEKHKGTGLGLSVVYGIVKSHDGEITVDSKPGEGTTFRIELPQLYDQRINN